MVDTITYWLATPRASGGVTFIAGHARPIPEAFPREMMLDQMIKGETLVSKKTAPYFRKAFGGMNRTQAVKHWADKGYQFKRIDG